MKEQIVKDYDPIPIGDIKIGTPVNYHSMIGRADCIPATISSEIWYLVDGTPVVELQGEAGGVSLRALSAR